MRVPVVRAAWDALVAAASSGCGGASSGAVGGGRRTSGDGSAAALPLSNVASAARAALTNAGAVFGAIHDQCKCEAPVLAASSALAACQRLPSPACPRLCVAVVRDLAHAPEPSFAGAESASDGPGEQGGECC